ncbi:MAG: hypothetical protein FWC95_01925 [Defluviitaleaceae bacterium]|nr:hypothetical protein [Defluviitaleaceae bacterium]
MVVYFNTYKLIKGSSITDFKKTVERLVKDIFANCKGVVSFKLLADGDGWADYTAWETMDDYNAFIKAAETPSEAALAFYGFINFSTCKSRVYTVEADMEIGSDG